MIDEIPKTQFGLQQYYSYALKEIRLSKNHTALMRKRVIQCEEEAEKIGIEIKKCEPDGRSVK